MSLLELKDKIKSHLVAGYPGLFIQSGEEARVDAMLQDIATQLRLSPKEWNLGYGWVDFFNKQPRGSQGTDTELANSLPALLDDDLDGKLFIIKDARSALENQPLAVARLKQLLNRIQRHHRGNSAVVLVSETLHIPSQIEAQITLLPLPLPRGEEISTQLDSVCQQLDLLVPENMRQRLYAACSGLSQEEIRSALAMIRLRHEQINDTALALIQHEKEQIIAKSGVLEMLRVNENAADIGGLENLKAWLGRRAQIFRRLREAREARVQAPKGVLIAGMPGCGKSLTAKAAAGLFQLPLLRLDIGSLLGKYVGESEHNMRRALTMAESVSPCILWIDELEKAFVGMNSGSGSEVSSRLFGYFLTWMQEKTGAVFVIATANNITALPPELLRKGRFDEVFYVGFPNAAERGAILDIHLKDDILELKPEQRSKLVAQCRDYAGADIQNAINEARESAFLDNRALKLEDLESAIELTVPLRKTLREQVGKYEELFEKLKLKPASTCEGLSVAQMIKLADEPNAIRRETVASNPDCPDDLLEKLVDDPELKVRTAVYRNPNCPERLLTLRINIDEGQPGFDLGLLHLACLHAHAPHDLLAAQFERLKLEPEQKRLLARQSTDVALHRCLHADEDPTVRRALALNKSLSKELQQQLAKDPVETVRDYLAANSTLHSEVQALLARDQSFEVRESLARLDELSEAVQLILVRDEDQDVRETLARRKRDALLPDSVQLELVKDCLEVRQVLARNESLGAPAQLLLAQDPDVDVRQTLAQHPALASATLQYLAKDIEAVQKELAGNHYLGSALLQMALSQSESEDVRKVLAGNSQLNVEVQTRLVRDPSESVRKALAGNDSATQEIVETLMCDENDDVRERLVRWRQNVLPSVQHHLATDSKAEIRQYLAYSRDLPDEVQQLLANDLPEVQSELANNASINATIQQQLLDRGNTETRRNLARNQALVGSVQARLAEDSDVEIRSALAGNSALAGPVADKLIGDVEEVQKDLARNSNLSELQYIRLFRNGSEEVRELLAGNPEIGETLMTQICHLEPGQAAQGQVGWSGMFGSAPTTAVRFAVQSSATGPVSKVKLALARNRNLPETLQTALLAQNAASVELLQALARNSSLSEAVQEELATHKDAKVREELAANGNISYKIERKLLKDSAASVRAALIREFWMDHEMELQLAQDTASTVRLALAANDGLCKATQLILARDPEKKVRARLLKRENSIFSRLNRVAQEVLAQDRDLEIRQLLAAYPKLEPSVQLLLATDESVSIRKALAKGGEDWFGLRLSEEVQLRLAKDRDTGVRLTLAENRRLSPNVQALLAGDADTKVKLKLIDQLSPLSLQAQQILAVDPDSDIRQELVDRLFGVFPFASSEEIRLMLAGDQDEGVRDRIIRNLLSPYSRGKCSDAVKARLLEGVDDAVREQLEEAERARELENSGDD